MYGVNFEGENMKALNTKLMIRNPSGLWIGGKPVSNI